MSSLSDYVDRYPTVHIERADGVLTLRLHKDGGPFLWDERTHHDLGELFEYVNGDHENRVVVLTGTGDAYCAAVDTDDFMRQAAIDGPNYMVRLYRDGARMLRNFVALEIPVIAAINGPVVTHSELPLLADVVLISETTEFRDESHMVQGIPPADGMQIVWSNLIGINRARHFLMTGRTIKAEEALALGVAAELLPGGELVPRAYELARQWAKLPLWSLQNTRAALNQPWRRAFAEDLHSGLAYEYMSMFAAMSAR
ncbi:enoyl-CoA hydratase/isomerase family protein [Streptomyces sp. NPDC057257]|uniref:enoyl-CoA hydratase/isomerase family protein n=1 Tax=Streptomyces sp. NPDC057257 TaxID=3346071 RepID=UPI003625B134